MIQLVIYLVFSCGGTSCGSAVGHNIWGQNRNILLRSCFILEDQNRIEWTGFFYRFTIFRYDE